MYEIIKLINLYETNLDLSQSTSGNQNLSLSPEDESEIGAQLNRFEQDSNFFIQENPKAGWIFGVIQAIQAKRVMTTLCQP